MSSPKTLASLDRTDPTASTVTAVARHMDKQFTHGWTECSTAWALPPATTQDLGHPRVPGADRFEGQRRTFVSTAGLAQALCCQGSRHAGSGADVLRLEAGT